MFELYESLIGRKSGQFFGVGECDYTVRIVSLLTPSTAFGTTIPCHSCFTRSVWIMYDKRSTQLRQFPSRTSQMQYPRYFVLAVSGKGFLEGWEFLTPSNDQIRFVTIRFGTGDRYQITTRLCCRPFTIPCRPMRGRIFSIKPCYFGMTFAGQEW